jgi:hypothetical protein
VEAAGTGLLIVYTAAGNIEITNYRGTLSPAEPLRLSVVGSTNVLIRCQRNLTSSLFTCEKWDYNGTGYVSDSATIVTNPAYSNSGGSIGGLGIDIGFFRVFTTLVPLRSKPPTTAGGGDWTELKFDGNGTDSSGNSHTATLSGATYASTPNQAPFACIETLNAPVWMVSVPFRAGHLGQLDGTCSYSMIDASDTVTYFWQQLDGPTTLVWSSRTNSQPTVTGAIFGSYTIQLTVTDTAGTLAVTPLAVGAVATDSNSVVVYPDDRLYPILGHRKKFGSHPWEWADERNLFTFDIIADRYEVNGGTFKFEEYAPVHNSVVPAGTAYVTSGSNKIFGVGTNFCTFFCGASTCANLQLDGATELFAMIDIPREHPDGPTAPPLRYPRRLASCESQTEVTMVSGYTWDKPTVSSPGFAWTATGFCSGATCGDWTTPAGAGNGNDNYYDNSLALYSHWYGSGSAKARDSARWLADQYSRGQEVYNGLSQPRFWSLFGSFIRATADSSSITTYPSRWSMLRDFVDYCVANQFTPTGTFFDQRELAYCLWYSALAARLDPDNTERSSHLTALTNAWSAKFSSTDNQHPTGYWRSNQYSPQSTIVLQMSQGSANVTRAAGASIPTDFCGTTVTSTGTISIDTDKVTVTGSGTTFTGTTGKIIYLRGTIDGGTPWSQVSRVASVGSATSMTLTLPWRGDQGSVTTQWKIINEDSIPGGTGPHTFYFKSGLSAEDFGDPDRDNWYFCTVTDGNNLVLDKPYTGVTSSNAYRRASSYYPAGYSQPFMDGLMAQGLYAAYDAFTNAGDTTMAANYKTAADNTVTALWTTGRDISNKGFFYFVGNSACKNLSIVPNECQPSDPARDYVVEAVGAFAEKYRLSGSGTDLTRLETIATDLFAFTGFTSPVAGDGTVATLLTTSGFLTGYKSKYFGQAFGAGRGYTAGGDYAGGVAPASPVLLSIPIPSWPLPKYSTSAKLRATVTAPNSTTTLITCTSNPCNISLDMRQGSHLLQIFILTSSDAVIATGKPQKINLPL